MVRSMIYWPKGIDWFFFGNGLIFAGLMLGASILFLMYVDGYFTPERSKKRQQGDGK